MSLKISSALRYHLLGTGSLATAANGSVIKIYGDNVSQAAAIALIPPTADASISTAILLCTISVEGLGTGLTFDPIPINGGLYKSATETWLGTNTASGYPSFYRLEQATDTGALSTTAIRAQGTVGQLAKDLIIASSYLTSGQEQRIDSYVIGMPVA